MKNEVSSPGWTGTVTAMKLKHPETDNFKEWLEMNESWFQGALYKINNQEYSVPKLAEWAKRNLKITNIPVSEIQKRYVWAKDLFIDVEEGEEWANRSMNTSLEYPILMLEYPNGKWEIIDGNHRTWKAWKTQQKSIQGYIIRSEQIPDAKDINKDRVIVSDYEDPPNLV